MAEVKNGIMSLYQFISLCILLGSISVAAWVRLEVGKVDTVTFEKHVEKAETMNKDITQIMIMQRDISKDIGFIKKSLEKAK